MKNFIKRFFELFTLKELLAMFGLGACGAVIARENYKRGAIDGYKVGVQECINITKGVIEEIDKVKAKDAAE